MSSRRWISCFFASSSAFSDLESPVLTPCSFSFAA